MDDQLGLTPFRVIFKAALQTYEKQTGITLAEHPLAVRLHSCRSVGSITALLKDQIPTSNDSEVLRIKTSLKNIISILSTLSTSGAFDWAIGLVRQKPLMAFPTPLIDGLCRHSHLKMPCMLVSLFYFLYVYSLLPMCVSL
jgi:hypothetical protein